jgi:hypothetical protein
MFRKINLELEEIGLAIVGFSSILHVQTQTWENSFQRENQMQHIIEATRESPEVARKLAGNQRVDRPKPRGGIGPVQG